MLLTEAENFVPLGPWHVWFFGHGLFPRPTVKKNFLSAVWGTLTGNRELARLRSLLVKFATTFVALIGGRVGLKAVEFEEVSYSSIPATVVLSNVPWPVKYGLANM